MEAGAKSCACCLTKVLVPYVVAETTAYMKEKKYNCYINDNITRYTDYTIVNYSMNK